MGYRLGNSIGEGSYCKVKVAEKFLKSGAVKKIACKIIRCDRASDEYRKKFLPRELAVIRKLNHPHIVKVERAVEIGKTVYIFMEFCGKGDLLEHIRTRGYFSEERAKFLFRQLVSAVWYLHQLDITHRDLKCENVLLYSENFVKLTDFGFSRKCTNPESGKRILSQTFCGSTAYAAPEILQGTPYNPKMYDVWSLGCILFIMLTCCMPFDDSSIPKLLQFQRKKQFTFPEEVSLKLSYDVHYLISRMLEPDVTRRITMDQVSNFPWFFT